MKYNSMALNSAVLSFAVFLFVIGMSYSNLMAQNTLTPGFPANTDFKQKIAGAYFAEFDASGLNEVPPGVQFFLPAITTIHEDGTALGLDATDGGLGLLQGFSINTPSQGNWVRTGRRSIRVVSLYLSFIRPEEANNTSGVLEAITRLTLALEFDPDFSVGSGLVCQQNVPIMNGNYDPTTDNPLELQPIDCTDEFPVVVPVTFKRIR